MINKENFEKLKKPFKISKRTLKEDTEKYSYSKFSKKEIKKLALNKFNNKIGDLAIKKINNAIEKNVLSILEKASRNALYSGRKIIKEEDVVE
ncbi:MAG: hypothetical protein AABW80_02360 [Nanoarchaeota archaeon]